MAASPSAAVGHELRRRAVSGFVLAIVTLAATYAGGWAFAVLWLAAGTALYAEWIGMVGAPRRGWLVAAAALSMSALLVAHRFGWPASATFAVMAAALAAAFAIARDGSRSWAMAGLVPAELAAVVPVLLRDRADLGTAAILWIFAVVWSTDVAAYFVGRALGGPRLAPRISPKKTWSGFAGGLAAATVAGLLVAAAAMRAGLSLPLGLLATGLAAGLASVASQAGDLGQSAMKRRFGVKDSGRLIPGHGGVFDRLDGFVAVLLLAGIALLGERLAFQPAGAP